MPQLANTSLSKSQRTHTCGWYLYVLDILKDLVSVYLVSLHYKWSYYMYMYVD